MPRTKPPGPLTVAPPSHGHRHATADLGSSPERVRLYPARAARESLPQSGGFDANELIDEWKATHKFDDKNEEAIIRELIAERITDRNRRAVEEDELRKITIGQLEFVRKNIAEMQQEKSKSQKDFSPESAASPLYDIGKIYQEYENELESKLKAQFVLLRGRHVLSRLREEEDRKLASKLPEFVLEREARASDMNFYDVAPISKIIGATKPPALKMASGTTQKTVDAGRAPKEASGAAPKTGHEGRDGTRAEIRLYKKILVYNDACKTARGLRNGPPLDFIRARSVEFKFLRSILEDRRMLLWYEYKRLVARRDSFVGGKLVVFPGLFDALNTLQNTITTPAKLLSYEQCLVFDTYVDLNTCIRDEYLDVTARLLELSYQSYFCKLALDGDMDTYLAYQQNPRNPNGGHAYKPEVTAHLAFLERTKNQFSVNDYNDYVDYLKLEDEIVS